MADKKIKSILNKYGKLAVSAQPDGGAASAMTSMAAPVDRAKEKASKKREAHTAAEFKVRTTESEVHSAIGVVLDGAAGIASLTPVQVLGLSAYFAEKLQLASFRAELGERGFAVIASQYAPGVALTMVGVPSGKVPHEDFKAAGFIRVGNHWAGDAKVPKAVKLATEHRLTLLRYDSDHVPVYFVRKGEAQPALAALEAEHAQNIESLRHKHLSDVAIAEDPVAGADKADTGGEKGPAAAIGELAEVTIETVVGPAGGASDVEPEPEASGETPGTNSSAPPANGKMAGPFRRPNLGRGTGTGGAGAANNA